MEQQNNKKILTNDRHTKDDHIDGESYLQFSVAGELYAVPLLVVKEVLPLQELSPIPRTPNYIIGMMNLRGQVITVADLAIKLNLQTKLIKKKNTVVMIVQKEDIQMGVIVEAVHQVLHLKKEDIAKSTGNDTEIDMTHITGIHQVKGEDQVVLIIDLEEALNINQLLK